MLVSEKGSASSFTVNPWSMPVTIKEISFHRSLNNRSIKLLFDVGPGSILHANCPIQCFFCRRDDFLQPTHPKWMFMYHHFYETFPPCRGNPCRHPPKTREDFLAPFPTQFMLDARSQSQRLEKFTSWWQWHPTTPAERIRTRKPFQRASCFSEGDKWSVCMRQWSRAVRN